MTARTQLKLPYIGSRKDGTVLSSGPHWGKFPLSLRFVQDETFSRREPSLGLLLPIGPFVTLV